MFYNVIEIQSMYNKSYAACINDKDRVFMPNAKENKKMQQITIKLKVNDLNRLREYADKKGGNPVSHYIREAVSEYLENHEDKSGK